MKTDSGFYYTPGERGAFIVRKNDTRGSEIATVSFQSYQQMAGAPSANQTERIAALIVEALNTALPAL